MGSVVSRGAHYPHCACQAKVLVSFDPSCFAYDATSMPALCSALHDAVLVSRCCRMTSAIR